MSKKMQSTLMLFLIGLGFGIFSVVSLKNALDHHQSDMVVQSLLYMVPAVAAFGALLLLPFKSS